MRCRPIYKTFGGSDIRPTFLPTSLSQNSFLYINFAECWQTVPDSYAITIKQNVRFQGAIFPE